MRALPHPSGLAGGLLEDAHALRVWVVEGLARAVCGSFSF